MCVSLCLRERERQIDRQTDGECVCVSVCVSSTVSLFVFETFRGRCRGASGGVPVLLASSDVIGVTFRSDCIVGVTLDKQTRTKPLTATHRFKP